MNIPNKKRLNKTFRYNKRCIFMELFELNTMQPSVGSSLRDFFIQLVQVFDLNPDDIQTTPLSVPNRVRLMSGRFKSGDLNQLGSKPTWFSSPLTPNLQFRFFSVSPDLWASRSAEPSRQSHCLCPIPGLSHR